MITNCAVPCFGTRHASVFAGQQPGGPCFVALSLVDQDGHAFSVHLPVASAQLLGETLVSAAKSLQERDAAFQLADVLSREEE